MPRMGPLKGPDPVVSLQASAVSKKENTNITTVPTKLG